MQKQMVGYDPIFDITGRSAIVTGASSGLGVTFASILAERGANVVLGSAAAICQANEEMIKVPM